MSRRHFIGAALALLALPVVLGVIAAASFYALDRTNGTIVSSGQKRDYLLHVSRSYDRARPTPLVICLHGAGLYPAAQMEMSHWNKVADEHGFLVVYPSGTEIPKSWGGEADVRFISDLIDTLEAAYNIDPTRIYANGFSNGGGMASLLACELFTRIAAVGTVAAANPTSLWSRCTDSRPMPMITFHGTADRFAPYDGGTSWVSPPGTSFAGVSTWTASWAKRNRCGTNPMESMVAADVTRLEYTHCAGDAAVVLYTIQGGGHSWPGGEPLLEWFSGPTTRSIDASELTWEFFRHYRLPGSPAPWPSTGSPGG